MIQVPIYSVPSKCLLPTAHMLFHYCATPQIFIWPYVEKYEKIPCFLLRRVICFQLTSGPFWTIPPATTPPFTSYCMSPHSQAKNFSAKSKLSVAPSPCIHVMFVYSVCRRRIILLSRVVSPPILELLESPGNPRTINLHSF